VSWGSDEHLYASSWLCGSDIEGCQCFMKLLGCAFLGQLEPDGLEVWQERQWNSLHPAIRAKLYEGMMKLNLATAGAAGVGHQVC